MSTRSCGRFSRPRLGGWLWNGRIEAASPDGISIHLELAPAPPDLEPTEGRIAFAGFGYAALKRVMPVLQVRSAAGDLHDCGKLTGVFASGGGGRVALATTCRGIDLAAVQFVLVTASGTTVELPLAGQR